MQFIRTEEFIQSKECGQGDSRIKRRCQIQDGRLEMLKVPKEQIKEHTHSGNNLTSFSAWGKILSRLFIIMYHGKSWKKKQTVKSYNVIGMLWKHVKYRAPIRRTNCTILAARVAFLVLQNLRLSSDLPQVWTAWRTRVCCREYTANHLHLLK